MTATTLTLTENSYPFGLSEGNDFVIIHGTASFGASPLTYSAGGMAISWTVGSNKFSSKGDGTNAGTPYAAEFVSQGPVSTNNYVYVWNRATEKLQIFTGAAAQTGLTELTDGAAIPAGVSGDHIAWRAWFKRF